MGKVRGAWVLLVVVGWLGCGEGGQGPREEFSRVSLALAAAGPDGRTYRLPPQAAFDISGGDGSVNSLSIGGSEANLLFTLPVGNYIGQARDRSASGDPAGVSWQLVRVNGDGTTSPVSATLHEPSHAFIVSAGTTTHVVLHYTVHGVGDVVFVTGRVDLSVAVDMDQRPATGGHLQGTLAVASQILGSNDGLNAAVGAPVGTTVPVSIKFKLAGPWMHRINSVCNTLSAVMVTADGAPAGLGAWLSELVSPSSSSLCIFESGFVSLVLSRSGPARSSLASELSGGHVFSLSLFGNGPTGIWDGTTLALSKLNDPFAMTASAFLQIRAGGSPFPQLAATSLAAPITLQFLP